MKTNERPQDLVEILREDYARFPDNQTYEIYSPDVYFKDPLNEFNGVKKYREMIGFLDSFFGNVKMDVHNLNRSGSTIKVEWTLNMTSPLPWKPRLSIPGWTELTVNDENLIGSHIDHWQISPWKVLRQNFF
ncbi:DUF2358 domain-containing protein [Pleurocapsales cyanobacterium LEGE 10410]|nr:DUF2358 domain-containing protein [Pleurocapsales cyanobacterium LEGE 10410]